MYRQCEHTHAAETNAQCTRGRERASACFSAERQHEPVKIEDTVVGQLHPPAACDAVMFHTLHLCLDILRLHHRFCD